MTTEITQTRAFTHLLATIVDSTCESPAIDVRPFHTMQVHMPAAWTAAALAIKVSPVKNTLFKPLYVQPSRHTVPVIRPEISSVTANTVYQFQLGIAGSGFVKLWSHDGVGADENQAADRVLGISLKG